MSKYTETTRYQNTKKKKKRQQDKKQGTMDLQTKQKTTKWQYKSLCSNNYFKYKQIKFSN